MAYCSSADLKERYTSERIDAWSNSDATIVSKVCEDTSAEIDGYIVGGGYPLPLSDVPALVKTHAISMAVYRLLSRYGFMGQDDPGEEGIKDGYAQAIRYFEQVAKGTLPLPVATVNTDEDKRVSVAVKSYTKLDLGGYV